MIQFAALLLLALQTGGVPEVDSTVQLADREEALLLAREIAANGFLPSLVPLQTASEIEGMIKDNPNLTPSEIETLRAIGAQHAEQLRAKLIELDARAYADALSLSDLRALAVFERSEAAAHRRAAMPQIMMSVVTSLGDVDYGGGVKKDFCSQTGKLCERD
ncbi:hypothetical protein [Citromicrobium bathyomarinum]|uniref:hypothetical protein n=1 Tax=Citromicrobium bathyomarinum TaxID=72174 RepID=UPI00315A671F